MTAKARSARKEVPQPSTADGFRDAWTTIEQLWPATVKRARQLPPDLLHANVRGEWSFIQTLRHLVFVSDAWLSRAYLGLPDTYHPLDLPMTGMKDNPAVPRDLAARPSLDEVLALRSTGWAGYAGCSPI